MRVVVGGPAVHKTHKEACGCNSFSLPHPRALAERSNKAEKLRSRREGRH